jgi:hypothetical protein
VCLFGSRLIRRSFFSHPLLLDRQLEQSIRSSEKMISLVKQLSQLGEDSAGAAAVATTGTDAASAAAPANQAVVGGTSGGGGTQQPSEEDGGPGPSDSVSQTGSDDLDGEAEVAALAHKILELLGLEGRGAEGSA